VLKILAFIALMFAVVGVYGQEPQIEIKKTTEKILVDGKIYYVHVIQQGQTMYSVSKAYNVTLQEIAAANPGINVAQVKVGQAIKIPAQPSQQEPVAETVVPDLEDDDFVYHQVKQGQTLYSVSKKYNVPIEIIFSYNPEAEQGLKAGTVLRIPKKKVLKDVIQAVRDDDKFHYYEVKKKDTLYSLARKYDVTIADIVNTNPELRWGLKPGQVIKIPKKAEEPDLIAEDEILHSDTAMLYSSYSCDTIRHIGKTKPVKVALILPLMSRQINRLYNDTLKGNVTLQRNAKTGSLYYEFYQGVLVALDSLKNAGYSISLNVYDTQADTAETKRIINRMKYDIPDMIIGPAFPENIKLVLNFASRNGIPIVSPFYNRSEQLNSYHEIFQVTPTREVQTNAIAEYASGYQNANIVVLHNGDNAANRDFISFRNAFHEVSIKKGQSGILNEVLNNDTLTANLQNALVQDKKNIVVILSENAIYVNGLLSKLDMNSKRFDILVIGNPSWLSFQTINIENFHNLEVTIPAPFFVDYHHRDTKSFLKSYHSLFGMEPNVANYMGVNISFLGYDVADFFVRAFYEYGNDFYRCIPYFKAKNLLVDFAFSQFRPDGGFENTSLNYIIFEKKDFEIKKAGYYKE
jgi:LysM repeat protein